MGTTIAIMITALIVCVLCLFLLQTPLNQGTHHSRSTAHNTVLYTILVGFVGGAIVTVISVITAVWQAV